RCLVVLFFFLSKVPLLPHKTLRRVCFFFILGTRKERKRGRKGRGVGFFCEMCCLFFVFFPETRMGNGTGGGKDERGNFANKGPHNKCCSILCVCVCVCFRLLEKLL
ncbi:hypothetical protein F5X99DRAFT_389896, partial [Biscogniauxia marginata]